MKIIKKIIFWIISFLRNIFRKKDCVIIESSSNINGSNKNTKNIHKELYNETLPSYMMITHQEKIELVNNIQELKKRIISDNAKEKQIRQIINILNQNINDNFDVEKAIVIQEYLEKSDVNMFNVKKIDEVLKDYSVPKDISIKVINTVSNQINAFNEALNIIDDILKYIEVNDVSLGSRDMIKDNLLNTNNNNDSSIVYNKEIVNKVKNWNDNIISEIQEEYGKVNYVMITTFMIDRIITKYQEMEDNYRNHRYNKYYYEREIDRIRNQIKYLSLVKNTSVVQEEIQKLRKELYTKSKDKYDILYNNEVFLNIDKKCQNLLSQVNRRIVDIKLDNQDDKKVESNINNKERNQYLQNILLRFEDLNLAQKLLLTCQNKTTRSKDILEFISASYSSFIDGINEEFNFQRNKTKTELIKLYNDINTIICIKKKEPFTFIGHINFKMSDLIEAVEIRKKEMENVIFDNDEILNSQLVDDKLEKLKIIYCENNKKKFVKSKSHT